MAVTSLLPLYAVVLIAVGVVLSCLVCVAITSVRLFVRSRHQPVPVLPNIKYLPEVVEIKHEYIHVRKKLTKRQIRRKRMRELARELRLTQQEKERWEEHERQIEDEDEPAEASSSLKIIAWVVSAFSSKSARIAPSGSIADLESGEGMFGFSTKSGFSAKSGEEGLEGSTKSKRFISQDRLQRREARLLLIKPKAVVEEQEAEVEEEVLFDNTVSLLSLAMAKRKRIAEIMTSRKLRKGSMDGTLGVDVVALNAGPSAELVPKGYEQVSQDLGPALLTPEVLVYKRILYLWDGSVGNISGWFIGTIVGISEVTGYNYRIKYDRAETGSIFVDGIQPVLLSLSGDQAYGRRWVVMQKIGSTPAETKEAVAT